MATQPLTIEEMEDLLKDLSDNIVEPLTDLSDSVKGTVYESKQAAKNLINSVTERVKVKSDNSKINKLMDSIVKNSKSNDENIDRINRAILATKESRKDELAKITNAQNKLNSENLTELQKSLLTAQLKNIDAVSSTKSEARIKELLKERGSIRTLIKQNEPLVKKMDVISQIQQRRNKVQESFENRIAQADEEQKKILRMQSNRAQQKFDEQIQVAHQNLLIQEKNFTLSQDVAKRQEKAAKKLARENAKMPSKDEEGPRGESNDFADMLDEIFNSDVVVLFSGLLQKIKGIFDFVSKFLSSAVLIGTTLGIAIGAATLKSKNFWKLVKNIFNAAFDLSKTFFNFIVDNWDSISTAASLTFQALSVLWETFSTGIDAMWSLVNGIFFETESILGGIGELTQGIGLFLKDILGGIPGASLLIDGLTFAYEKLFSGIIISIKSIPNVIAGVFKYATSSIANSISTLSETIFLIFTGNFSQAFDRLISGVKTQFQLVSDFLTSLPIFDFITNTFSEIFNFFISKGKDFLKLLGVDIEEDVREIPTNDNRNRLVNERLEENKRLILEASKLDNTNTQDATEQRELINKVKANRVFIKSQDQIIEMQKVKQENEKTETLLSKPEPQQPQPSVDIEKMAKTLAKQMSKEMTKAIEKQPKPTITTQTIVGSPAVPVPGQSTWRSE